MIAIKFWPCTCVYTISLVGKMDSNISEELLAELRNRVEAHSVC